MNLPVTKVDRAPWMTGKNSGVMVHFLPHILNRDLSRTPEKWDDVVNAFDVAKFCRQVKDTGAKWIIFPFGQNEGKYCSPNPVLDSYIPDYTCKRNLMKELAQCAADMQLKFIAYLPAEVCFRELEYRNALGWFDDEDKSTFQKRYEKIVRYWAGDLGYLLDGWWFDGCYTACEKSFVPAEDNRWTNDRFTASWFAAIRAGNPSAAVAMCHGANSFGYVSVEQDYLAGEMGTLMLPPEESIMHKHALLSLDLSTWIFCIDKYHPEKEPELPEPRFAYEELLQWRKECCRLDCAVTYNIGIYRDGTMPDKSIECVKKLNNAIEDC